MAFKINEWTLGVAKGLGLPVKDEYNTLKEVLELIPSRYYFSGELLWCGDYFVNVQKYNTAETVVHMAIRLKRAENGDNKIYGGPFS